MDRERLHQKFVRIVTDDEKRRRMQFICVFSLLAAISGFMTVVNVATRKGTLTWVTLVFALLCLVDLLILLRADRRWGLKISSALLMVQLIALFIYFIVSGSPEGFSAIWICMLPACGMLLYDFRTATVFSGVMLAILIFLLQTPWGQGLVRFEYTDSFRLRFPMLFVAFYLITCILEGIRVATQNELTRIRNRYAYLSSHDALTSLLNRHGLYEWRDSVRVRGEHAVMMIDLDFFKHVNDSYGHDVGDLVLASVSQEVARHVDTQICRWGGEEFVVWFPKGNLKDRTAEEIRAAVEALVIHVPNCDKTIRITISIGVARASADTSLEDLIRLADSCLYQAKESGRNRVVSG